MNGLGTDNGEGSGTDWLGWADLRRPGPRACWSRGQWEGDRVSW